MKRLLGELCPFLTEQQLERFDCYYRMLTEWNARMNLTAITAPAEVARKHFADSLSARALIPDGARVVDVGTGAGFPGVPLLICNPTLRLTLLDGLNKRLTFLRALLDALGLAAECVHMRAEDAGRDPRYRERFDVATTRAVAALPVLVELTTPLVKTGGKSIAYKGDAADELAASRSALELLHVEAELVLTPADYGVRTLAVLTKRAPTPARYPRRAGIPAKNPL